MMGGESLGKERESLAPFKKFSRSVWLKMHHSFQIAFKMRRSKMPCSKAFQALSIAGSLLKAWKALLQVTAVASF